MSTEQPLRLFTTPLHACPYLPDRWARDAVADPDYPMSPAVYGALLERGMRRSGPNVYAPVCPGCSACQSLRIPVERFRPDRTQRRCWRRNADLRAIDQPAEFRREHFALYKRYLAARHPDGPMVDHDPDDWLGFLTADWADTRFVEFRRGAALLAVAVVDRVPGALSAVYTFFEPEEHRRSLGTHAILWQIDAAQRTGCPYLYLGYWIAESGKMRYKAAFRPCEVYHDGRWREHDAGR